MTSADDVSKGLRAIEAILNSNDSEIQSLEFLMTQVLAIGLANFEWDAWRQFANKKNASTFGLIEYPTDLAELALTLRHVPIYSSLAPAQPRFLSWYFLAAVLQRNHPGHVFTISDPSGYAKAVEPFSELLNLEIIKNSMFELQERSFDFVIIDGDCGYDSSVDMFMKVGRRAKKAVAFHDICGHEHLGKNGGIMRAWNEVKTIEGDGCEITEIASSADRWMGIGLIVKKQKENDAFNDAKKGLSVVRRILDSSDRDFHDREFILKAIYDFGLACHRFESYGPYVKYCNKSEFGLLQYPPEFADFAMFIAAQNITSAIEIGVYRGASSYFLAAMLQRAVPDVRYHMVDIIDNIVCYKWFAEHLNIETHLTLTSEDFKGQEYDFVFIDADHSYPAVKLDYDNIGKYCKKMVAFHDIYGHEYDYLDGGVYRFWQEFKSDYSKKGRLNAKEFALCPVEWMGLGIGVRV